MNHEKMTKIKQEWADGLSFKQQVFNKTSYKEPNRSTEEALSQQQPSTNEIKEGQDKPNAGDRNVPILMSLNSPRVVQFGELLSPEECHQLIALSKPRLKPSTVVNPVNGNYDFDPTRSSQGCFFQRGEFDVIQRIEQRISHLLKIPVTRGESISVLNYKPGEEYRPHWDYFDPKNPGNKQSLSRSRGGQRYATLIMYLNNVEAGGSTIFPEIGLNVLPHEGHAVFFAYANHEGYLDKRSLHGGSPVEKGEKWIATKWLRLHDF
ncbi:2OG-Fe(II) oxygenase [Aliikangiella sp. IMCC44359]|uniref:2OG-Fe(II) oxygenase n=1 Tax=Aliikangiella sp. IMCC44359 TaxID=3459125 RepID=UPI00403A9123